MDNKEKALDAALAQIEKQFGKGAVMKLGDASKNMNIEAIPTGCLELDIALGIGGVPRGRIIEVYGPESSGKTTVALHMIAEAQKLGGAAAFIDAEHALDPVYAKNLGVDIDNLYVSQPSTGDVYKRQVQKPDQQPEFKKVSKKERVFLALFIACHRNAGGRRALYGVPVLSVLLPIEEYKEEHRRKLCSKYRIMCTRWSSAAVLFP